MADHLTGSACGASRETAGAPGLKALDTQADELYPAVAPSPILGGMRAPVIRRPRIVRRDGQ